VGTIFSHFVYDLDEIDYNSNQIDLDHDGYTELGQSFIQSKFNISDRFLLTGGLHFIYFWLTRDWSLEPRIGVEWDISKKQSLHLGVGKHSRHEIFPVYFFQVIQPDNSYTKPNKDLEFVKSYHTLLTYDHHISTDLHFKVDLYYQYFRDIPVRNIPPYILAPFNGSFTADSLFNRGTARNYGIEITVERYFSDEFYFMSGTSLFDSKINPGNDTLYHTKFNRRFIQNLVGGKEFRIGKNRQNLFGINAKLLWAGGNRGKFDPYNGEVIEDEQNRFGVQYGNYFRIDMNIIYRINQPRISHILSIDVQNITNRKNPLNQTKTHSGILPIAAYKIEF
jgi:hypothetical protein